MAIQKTFTDTDRTVGNYWKIVNAQFAIDGNRTTIVVMLQLYTNATDAAASGVTPMLSRSFAIPAASVFNTAQLNLLRTNLQNYLIANEPTFSGGIAI